MFDAVTAAACVAASTPTLKAEAVRDSLGSSLTAEILDGESVVYSGAFTGPLTASGGALSVDVRPTGVATGAGTPDPASWRLRIRNDSGRWVEGTLGPGGRFTLETASLGVGQAIRLNVSIAAPLGITGDLYSQDFTAPTSAALPITWTAWFAEGEVPAGAYLTADVAPFQAVNWNTYPDGSLRTAVCSAVPTFTATVPKAIKLSKAGIAPSGSNITEATLIGLAPDVRVAFSNVVNTSSVTQMGNETVTLASVLGQTAAFGAVPANHTGGLVRSILGPVMSEFHYYAKTADTFLRVWFYVRVYVGGQVEVEIRVSNGWTFVTGHRQLNYTATISVGGTQRWSGLVYQNARTEWAQVHWVGTDPSVVPKLNLVQLKKTRIIPNYPAVPILSSVASGIINGTRTKAYQPNPGERAWWRAFMSNTSDVNADSMGVHHYPAALYFQSGDDRAYYSALSQDRAHHRYPIQIIDETTGRAARPRQYPNSRLASNGGHYYGTGTSSVPIEGSPDGYNPVSGLGENVTWDQAHQAPAGPFTFLAEGRFSAVEHAQYYHSANLFSQATAKNYMGDPLSAFGRDGAMCYLVRDNNRGQGRSLATMLTALLITPTFDSVIYDDLVDCAQNNINYMKTWGDSISPNELGVVYKGPGEVGPWQMNIFSASIGYMKAARLPISAQALAELDALCLRVLGTMPVKFVGDNTNWNYRYCNIYYYTPTSGGAWLPNMNTAYNTLRTANRAPVLSDASGLALMQTDGVTARTTVEGSYYRQIYIPLAYAVDFGYPGAAEGWARLMSSTTTYTWGADARYQAVPYGFTF